MSGQHNEQQQQQQQQQQSRQQSHHQTQREQTADRRSQVVARANNGQQQQQQQQLSDDQQLSDYEEEFNNDKIFKKVVKQQEQQHDNESHDLIRTTNSLNEIPQSRSELVSSGSELSVALSEQVITSLQVNSKKFEPINDKQATTAPPPTTTTALTTLQSNNKTPLNIHYNNKPPIKSRDEVGKHILDPSGSLYYHWSMVVSFAFLYNFWSLSYRFAFREIDFDTVAFWFALDYSADIIYILDVVINSRTGYLEDGVLQRNKDKISVHYRECTLFYLDCFCLLPLDILYLSIGFNSILRCTRLVKIYKFWSYVDRTERHTNYPNVFRTFTLVHYILVIFHWNACLFHMISKNKIIDIEDLYKINDNRCLDVLCQYLHAFYWSTLALTTIGDLPRPRTKGEYVFVIVELFFGLFIFASVLGHVANIVTNVSAARKEFQAKLDAVKTFMRMRRVSDELQSKVIRWFDYLWISQKSSDEDRSVACLPDRLKAEIAIHVHLDTLKRVDIFQNTEAGFLCELVLRLKPVLFSPGDYVCRKNEVGHEMYIVSRGILEVVTDEGKTVVATLKAGSYFGEISVLNVGLAGNKRTASVRSVGYSDLFCLNKQDLWDVLKNYPNAEARIRARAEERLNKLDINQSRTSASGGQVSASKIGSLKSFKSKNTGDFGGQQKSQVINGSVKSSIQRNRQQTSRSLGRFNNCLIKQPTNRKQLSSMLRQNNQISCCNELSLDRSPYRYEDINDRHRHCCHSNQSANFYAPSKNQSVCDNAMISTQNNSNQRFMSKASVGSSRSSSQESLSEALVGLEDDKNQLIMQPDETIGMRRREESIFKNNKSSGSKVNREAVKKIKQRRQNYPTVNSEQIKTIGSNHNKNVPATLLSASINSELEGDRRDYSQHFSNSSKLLQQRRAENQQLGCEPNIMSKCCQQHSIDDSCSISSSYRGMNLKKYLRRRTNKVNHHQLVRQNNQCHHSYSCCDEASLAISDLEPQKEKQQQHQRQQMSEVSAAALYPKQQLVSNSSAAVIAARQAAGQQAASFWLSNQPIYTTSNMETTMPKSQQEGGGGGIVGGEETMTPRSVGPIIQVPMLATPTLDGRYQMLQPIITNNLGPQNQSLSMTHLNTSHFINPSGLNTNLHGGQVLLSPSLPRSAQSNQFGGGQFLFVNHQMNQVDDSEQLSKSSQSVSAQASGQRSSYELSSQAAGMSGARDRYDDEIERSRQHYGWNSPREPIQRQDNSNNRAGHNTTATPTATTSADGSSESGITATTTTTGANLRLEFLQEFDSTNGNNTGRQFRVEMSELAANISGGAANVDAKLPESGQQSSNDLSELPFERDPNKDTTS